MPKNNPKQVIVTPRQKTGTTSSGTGGGGGNGEGSIVIEKLISLVELNHEVLPGLEPGRRVVVRNQAQEVVVYTEVGTRIGKFGASDMAEVAGHDIISATIYLVQEVPEQCVVKVAMK